MEDARVENWMTSRDEKTYFQKTSQEVFQKDLPSLPQVLLYQSKTLELGKLKVTRRARYQLAQTNVCHLLFRGDADFVQDLLPPSFLACLQQKQLSLQHYDVFDSHFYLKLELQQENKNKLIDHPRTLLLVNPINFEFKLGWIDNQCIEFDYPLSPSLDSKDKRKTKLDNFEEKIHLIEREIDFLTVVFENVSLIHRIYIYESACVFIPLAFELAEQQFQPKHPIFAILQYLNQDLSKFRQQMKYSYNLWSLFTTKSMHRKQKSSIEKTQDPTKSNQTTTSASCFSFRKAKLLILESEVCSTSTPIASPVSTHSFSSGDPSPFYFADPVHSFILSASSRMLNTTKVIFARGYSQVSLKNNPYYETYMEIQKMVRKRVEDQFALWNLTTLQNAEFKLWGERFCSFLQLDVSFLDNFEGVRTLVDLICLKLFFWTGPWFNCFDSLHVQKPDHLWKQLLKSWNMDNKEVLKCFFLSTASSSSSSPSFPSLQSLIQEEQTPGLFKDIYKDVLSILSKNERLCIQHILH